MPNESAEGERPPAGRRAGLRALAATLPAVVQKALGRRGFAEGSLVTEWRAIMGEELAAASAPLRIAFPRGRRREGVLHLRVAGALATELQHREPLLLERINGYFGYRAVGRLQLHQGPVAGPPPAAAEAAPAEADPALADRLAGIEDATLRAALLRLGHALRRRPG